MQTNRLKYTQIHPEDNRHKYKHIVLSLIGKHAQYSQAQEDYIGDDISINKGNRLELILNVGETLALVRTPDNEYGYIPMSVLGKTSDTKTSQAVSSVSPLVQEISKQTNVTGTTRVTSKGAATTVQPLTSVPVRPSALLPCDPIPGIIVRKKVTQAELETPSSSDTTPTRPDTPPLEAFIEANKMSLSDTHNSHQPFSPSSEKSPPLTDDNFIKYYYPEVEEKSWKTNIKKVIKSLRSSINRQSQTTLDSVSQRKSLHSYKTHKTAGGRSIVSADDDILMPFDLPAPGNSKTMSV